MLVHNEWRHDTRVIREAETLVRAGCEVHVACRSQQRSAAVDREGGVTYHSIPYSQPDPGRLTAYLRIHLGVVRDDAAGLLRRGRRRSGLRAASELALAPVAGTAAAAAAATLVGLDAYGRTGLPGNATATRIVTALSAWAARNLQPMRYLNEFADTVLPHVRGLAPDIVHAHDLVTLSAGRRLARELRLPLVYDAHELETHTNYHTLTARTKRWIARYEAVLAPRTERVVTVCDSIADWLEHEYRIRRPAVVMNVPASTEDATALAPPSASGDVRSAVGVGADIPLVVYIGSVTVDRGLERCVEALARLPGVHLATVGPRYEQTEQAMRERARALGVEDQLHLLDPVPSAQVSAFVATADCSVMAIQNVCLSYYYCFPNKLLESVVAGLPVVVADLFELRRFVERYNVGIVADEQSAEAIAEAIETVLNARDRFAPTAVKTREIVAAYGWGRQARVLLEVYEELTGRRLETRQAPLVPSAAYPATAAGGRRAD